MDKTNTTKDIRGKAKEVGLEKEWNEGFYHARRMTKYD